MIFNSQLIVNYYKSNENMALITSILVTAFILGVVAISIYHIKRLYLYRAASKMSGPRVLPLIGNAHYFFGDTTDIINKVMELLNEYSSPVRVWLGNQLYIAISHPEQMKAVFLSSKTIEKGDLYRFIRPWLGTGLFSAPAAKWRTHRKLIMPTFNIHILESFIDVFAHQSVIMTKQMEVELHGNEFDVFAYISLCTLDIICETAMGVSGNAQVERHSSYLHAVKTILEIVYTRMLKGWLYSDIIFNFTSLAKQHGKCLEILRNHTDNVIQIKRGQSNKSPNLQNDECHKNIKSSKKAFLDLLMELSNEGTTFTNDELREEVDTMMVAGNDTTATVNSFVIFMLANFPEIQQKCYNELCEIFGDQINNETRITRDEIRQMEYLERVIKETMRLFPVGPIIVRKVTDDLDIGRYTLPKGSSVALAIMQLHRRPDIWVNPLEFNPDRFLPDEVAKRHPYSFVPFSAGPRNCIGLQYAMISMKVLIATVLRKYSLQKDLKVKIEDVKLKADLILKPANPITVKILKR